MILLLLVILSSVLLAIPSFIVLRWKARPVRSYLIALGVLYLAISALMAWGLSGNEMFEAEEPKFLFAEKIIFALAILFVLAPILALIQWFGRRRYKRELGVSREKTKQTFD
ncbi:hypothetical protein GCM10011309_15970 [Litorimonas cladophorae]|uniref:Uncharacterized protein n=1 Tax=Litorimonas cladophorae TaxID=1220491 RepID=A0A918KL59_9PROT|nr:hypothetical protein [Litorimonas cladophorae]GGX67123.1 hypothetical protein GCM10011309_15970 [Litorimonas cladophorae]